MTWLNNFLRGRINRQNYLYGFLLVLLIIAPAQFTQDFSKIFEWGLEQNKLLSMITIITSSIASIFEISLQVRRLHDLGVSGWMFVLNFIPIINIIYWIYLFFAKGQVIENKYGLVSESKSSIKKILFNIS